ncbi:MAG: cbb3-type cytochrome c oxidase subunit 3 [Pseudomonadota bacterium]
MYEPLAQFAQTWGLIIFIVAFVLVLIYALAPGNRAKFSQAARIPLDDGKDEDNVGRSKTD